MLQKMGVSDPLFHWIFVFNFVMLSRTRIWCYALVQGNISISIFKLYVLGIFFPFSNNVIVPNKRENEKYFLT